MLRQIPEFRFLDAIASREPALLSVDGHSPLKMSITMPHFYDGHSPYKMFITHSCILNSFEEYFLEVFNSRDSLSLSMSNSDNQLDPNQ